MTKLLYGLLILAITPLPVARQASFSQDLPYLRIFVDQDRWYRIMGSDIAAAGLPLTQVSPSRLNLYNQGSRVPIAIENLTPDGGFGPASTIGFWGEFPRGTDTRTDLVARENTYTLRLDGSDPPERYAKLEAPPQTEIGGPAVETCQRTLHMERDSLLVYRQHYYGLATDRTMWRSFRAPPRDGGAIRLDSIPDLLPGSRPSRIRMLLWGSSHLLDNPDHDWAVSLNGGELGRAQWDGTTHLVFASDSIGALFRPRGPNTLSFLSKLQGDRIDSILLDWIEIDYQALLTPSNDFLEFELPADNGGMSSVRLAGGFSAATIRVFDVAHALEVPATPRKDRRTHAYGAEFRCPSGTQKPHFVAVGPGGYSRPARMVLAHPSGLRAIKQAPEYLVITHRDFLEGARELVERRRAQGLSTLLVDVDNVYDEYSDGRFSPDALKRFVDDLLAKPGPDGKGLRYVFLVGDATCDYKGVMKDSANFVPTYDEKEEGDVPDYMPMYARDDYFVYGTDGTRVPKAAIGRLPCRTPEELQHFLEKLRAFEASPAPTDSSWTRRGVFIGAEGFEEMCRWVAAEAPFRSWQIDTIFAKAGDVPGNAKLQERILQSLDRGAGAVYFIGHGALLRWRTGPIDPNNQSDLFTKEHLAKLTNGGHYPVVLTSTCYSTMYDNPYSLAGSDAGIGVYMVLAEGKGAIACVGHVGKTTAGSAQLFSQRVIDELFGGSAPRLGDAFIATKRQLYSGEWAGIALIGDPATYFGTRYAPRGGGVTPTKAGK